MDVVKYIEKVPKGQGDRPVEPVTIASAGEIKQDAKVKDEL